MAPPTLGHCEGLEAHEIVEGHFGEYQAVIDERAAEEQAEALCKVLSGAEQAATTLFNIYAATIDTEHDPIRAEIDVELDLPGRTARFAVADVMDARIEPIRNPVTGESFAAQIRLPRGFEFREAETASGSFWGKAAIPQDYDKRFAYSTYGPVEEASYPNGRL